MPPIAKQTAVYLRVSSKSQKTDSQRAEIRRWLRGEGIDPDACRWYIDTESGKTGSAESRPELQRLETDIFNGEIRTVVTWKLDRLARSQRDGIDLMHRWLEKGIRLIVTTLQIDLRGAVGRMVAGLLFSLAEIERDNIRERQRAGIEVAKQAGKYQGRKPGTTKAKPRRAKTLRERGLTHAEIGKALGVSRHTVIRYLQSV